MKNEILSRISGGSKDTFIAILNESEDIKDLFVALVADTWGLVVKLFLFMFAIIAFPFAVLLVPFLYVLVPPFRRKCKADYARKLGV